MEKTKGMGKQIYLAAIQDDCCRVYYCNMTFPIADVLDEWSFNQRSCENLGDHFKAWAPNLNTLYILKYSYIKHITSNQIMLLLNAYMGHRWI